MINLMRLLAFLCFIGSLFFLMWAIQAAWLTSFTSDTKTLSDYSSRFELRIFISGVLFVGTIFSLYQLSRLKNPK